MKNTDRVLVLQVESKIFVINFLCTILFTLFIFQLPYIMAQAQQPQLMTNFGHYNICLDISPDNKMLATGDREGNLKIWDIGKGREIRSFCLGKEISLIAFKKDCDDVIVHTGYWKENQVQVYRISTNSRIFESKILSKSLAYSYNIHSDKPYIVLQVDNCLKVIDYQENRELLSIKKGYLVGENDNTLMVKSNSVVKYYSINTLKPIKEFVLNEQYETMAVSPDEKYFATWQKDGMIKLRRIENGEVVKQNMLVNTSISRIKFSPNGKYIAIKNGYFEITLLNSSDLSILYSSSKLENPGMDEIVVAFSNDSRYLSYSSNDRIEIYDISTGETSSIYKFNFAVKNFIYSKSGDRIIVGSPDGNLKIWNLGQNSNLQVVPIRNKGITGSAISNDGKEYYTYGTGIIKKYSTVDYKLIDTSGIGSCNSINISPDGKLAFCMKLWDIEKKTESALNSGAPVSKEPSMYYIDASFSNSNRSIAFLDPTRNKITIMDRGSGQISSTFSTGIKDPGKIIYSPDDKFLAVEGDGSIYIYNLATKDCVKKIKTGWLVIDKVVYSNDGSMLAIYVFSFGVGTILLYDLAKNTFVKTEPIQVWHNYVLDFSPDDKFLIYGGVNGRLHFVNTKSGLEEISLIEIPKTSDWVAVTYDGRFDGTEGGFKYLHFVDGLNVVPLESLFENFYTPNLLNSILQGENLVKPDIGIVNLLPIPKVKIVNPANGLTVNNLQFTINVEVFDQGGGIDEVRLYHNGKLLDGTTRGFKSTGQNHEFTVTLTNGENRIKATAFNSQRTESIPDEIVVHYKAPEIVKPNMHILAVGINNYMNPKYNLNYAKNDADAFVKSLSAGASSLFGKVEVTTINDANATKIGILAAIEKIKSASKAEDVFVFYYAGHGVMSSGNGVEKPLFYLVPHDVTKMYEADELLKKSGISATEIGEFSKTIKAQKQLFVIDACQSGGAMQTLAMRGAAEEKAIAQLARSTGTYFIAASGTEQFATEVAELGHGIFTYSVIEALKGSCKSQDGKVTVNLLKSCVEDLVPELSKKHKGQPQFPTGYGFGMDFPVVMVK